VESAGRGPINENREGDRSYTFHYGVDQLLREIHSFQSGLNEFPFKPIIGFGHIRFDTHITSLFGSLSKVVEDFIGYKSVVRD
jgi:hypothetical protein